MDETAKAYKALPGYADHGKFTIGLTIDGKARNESRPMAVVFARPNKVAIDAGEVQLVGDGKQLSTTILPSKMFMQSPENRVASVLFDEGPLGAILLGGPTGPAVSRFLNAHFVLDLLILDEPLKPLLEQSREFRLEGEAALDGVKVKIVRAVAKQGSDILLYIDETTKLLRKVELTIDPKAAAQKVPGVSLSDAAIAWTSGPSALDVPKEGSFRFKPLPKFAKVEPVKISQKKAGADEGEKHPLVGKPAPDFTFTMLDGPGKTKKVSKTDWKGKVVVIDFWATWCGPCMLELPEIAKVAAAYADSKKPKDKDLVIIALSQDENEDLADVRKLIENTLQKQDIDLERGETGKIGLDPTRKAGKAFGVEGIPTVVLIDRDGLVQSVHVGYSPDIAEKLTAEIDAVLEGSPLHKGETLKKSNKTGAEK